MDELGVNDMVTWTSQANGYTKTKTGCVVAVVPAGVEPFRVVPTGFSFVMQTTLPRNHKSYLVAVPNKTGGYRKDLYWPIAGRLQKTGVIE